MVMMRLLLFPRPSILFLILESDSDFLNEQLTGNIHKVAIVPPNYTGRPRKGHLIFDACFECGKFFDYDEMAWFV